MKRTGLLRVVAAALGGLAAVTALAAFSVVASVRGGLIGTPDAPLWIAPLVAGGTVGALVWFLLTGASAEDPLDERTVTVACPICGNSIMEDWRLCPHCGSSRQATTSSDCSAPTG